MQEIRRNILYQIKKQSNKRSDPYYNPNQQDDDIRKDNQKLRTKIRSQDTQIIRLNSKIDDLNQKIMMYSTISKADQLHRQNSMNQSIETFSNVPILLENKQLKQNNQILHQQLLRINGKNNELQAEIRQIKSDKYELELRIKQFNILEKMREERFKDQVDRLTPIIVEEPSEYTAIKNALQFLTKFMRERVVDIVENIFMMSVKQCQKKKTINSFIVFTNYWKQINSKKMYGFAAAISAYTSLVKVVKMIHENYGEIQYNFQGFKDTIDQWVLKSIIEIKVDSYEEAEKKLFRLLGLKYRCRFPINGQKFEMNEKIKGNLEHAICEEISKLLIPLKNKPKQNVQDGEMQK